MQQTTQAYLIIQLGSRWTDILRLQPEHPILVGRSSECQIVVKHERVSRKHARVFPQEGGWAVEDLGSRNGTQVDGMTIEGPRRLSDGETIEVGGCSMTFSHSLSQVAQAHRALSAGAANTIGSQQTEEVRPTIVNRLANSQWSSEGIDAGQFAANRATANRGEHDHWNFFYRLVFDLVACRAPENAAQIALDLLLTKLQLSAGGVITFEKSDDPKQDFPLMAVLATRQAKGGSYHRVSDFLVQAVARDKQAVLARNVQDDSKLSMARASGQREIVSIICAPLRFTEGDPKTGEQQERVAGLLHVYSAGDERMLSEADLELAVGVADNLAIALQRQSESQKLAETLVTTQRQVSLLQEQLDEASVMVGESASLKHVKESINKAGPTDATVLVRGESGVGKELVARAIHQASHRKKAPLVCLNCAALAPTLLESELFGHEKGAFTGATERKIGKFEAADGGTILLDEIGEMSAELQAKFLRVLEGQPFERLGGNKAIKTNVRVIAATNRALEEAVEAKEFRADLYYRLRVIEIDVPPLRQRLDDVPLLVEHFLDQLRHHAARRLSGISPEALEILTRHSWPGNVRELRNVVERAIVLGSSSTIEPADLSISSLGNVGTATAPGSSEAVFQPIPLADVEKAHILKTLDHAEGNKTKAAQMLGIERSTLDRKLKRYKVEES